MEENKRGSIVITSTTGYNLKKEITPKSFQDLEIKPGLVFGAFYKDYTNLVSKCENQEILIEELQTKLESHKQTLTLVLDMLQVVILQMQLNNIDMTEAVALMQMLQTKSEE